MVHYHVIDILVDQPHLKERINLPVWIRHVTGVLFFPVIPSPEDGVPDGEPLGVAGFSLQNEKLNIITNQKIYKKNPIYFISPSFNIAGGEVLLDRGYGAYDFFECNDDVLPNSYAVFKFTSRKMIKSFSDTERYNQNLNNLRSLMAKKITYKKKTGQVSTIDVGELKIYIGIHIPPNGNDRIEFFKKDLYKEIYSFLDTEGQPYFTKKEEGFEEPYTMKIILRYATE